VVRGPIEHNPGIAIVAIDEKSIAELGRYPWSREVYVPFLQNTTSAGAKAVLFDAFFPEEQDREADRAFAGAIRRARNVTLSAAMDYAEDPDVPDLTVSIPALTEAARHTAHINFLPDEDGVNRHNLLLAAYHDPDTGEEKVYPSLGLMGAMEALGLGMDDLEPDEHSIHLGDIEIPVTYAESATGEPLPLMLVNYTGPPGTYETIPFVDIVKGRVEPRRLKDRILLFGATALGIYDMRESPFHPNTPGVEVHANVTDSIIRGEFMSKGGLEALLDLFFIFALSGFVYFFTISHRPVVALPAAFSIIVAYLLFASYMFTKGSWLSMVYPVLSPALTYAFTAYFRFTQVDRKAREMRTIFSSYVSRKVVDELVHRPEAAKIGGDKKDITILFSDVKGYTSYSEKHEPEEVVETLNEYLGAMSSVIIDSDGTLDKFLGDGIMSYWGAPLAQENHHELGVRCALDMLRRLGKLREKWASEGTEPFSIRVGLNSGKVIAGNIGAVGKKMEYTVIGDNVNLAARLEGTGKAYGVTVIASESTYEPTKDKFLYRELDCIRVVGKTQPIRIYELIESLDKPVEGWVKEKVRRFEEALSLYRDRRFTDAKAIFEDLASGQHGDPASGVYVERCENFISAPPPGEWDGVYTRTSK
jgi:adenylate cyclase